MISQKTMDALKSIGLNLYERKLFVALLSRGTSTAGELAELSKVPRSRTYDVLESLADKGFVVVKNAKPLQYVAVDPSEAIERSKTKIKSDFNETISRLEEFKKSDSLSELSKLHKTGMNLVDVSDLTGTIKGRFSMHQHIEGLIKNAEKSLDIITSEDGLNDIHRMHSGLIQKAADKGVKCRIIAPITEKNKEASEMLSAVCDIKDMSKAKDEHVVSGRIILKDGKEAVLALTDDKETHQSQDAAFWSASEHLAKDVLTPTFEGMWKKLD